MTNSKRSTDLYKEDITIWRKKGGVEEIYLKKRAFVSPIRE